MNKLLSILWRRLIPDITVHRTIRGTKFNCSLKYHAHWLLRGDRAAGEDIPWPCCGIVWDLGCNIGVYAVEAAKLGCQVYALDISFLNIWCLQHTAAENGLLNLKAANFPITVNRVSWWDSKGGHTEQTLKVGGLYWSTTYSEFALVYGMPVFIKMDIQGGEMQFLKSEDFRRWVISNRIGLYVETHGDSKDFLWAGFKQIGPTHFLWEPCL